MLEYRKYEKGNCVELVGGCWCEYGGLAGMRGTERSQQPSVGYCSLRTGDKSGRINEHGSAGAIEHRYSSSVRAPGYNSSVLYSSSVNFLCFQSCNI